MLDLLASATYELDRRVGGGFLAFGALAVFGLRLLARGVRNDIYDWLGHAPAPRAWFIVGGVLCQLPLVAWVVFLIKQGWFTGVQLP